MKDEDQSKVPSDSNLFGFSMSEFFTQVKRSLFDAPSPTVKIDEVQGGQSINNLSSPTNAGTDTPSTTLGGGDHHVVSSHQ